MNAVTGFVTRLRAQRAGGLHRSPTRRSGALLATAVTVLGGLTMAVSSGTAEAATARNGVCETGEFCYYYNSGKGGSLSDFTTSVPDLGAEQPSCYDFKSDGAGKGTCTKNHAASAWNRTSQTVKVFVNSGYGGGTVSLAPGESKNLGSLANDNAAHLIVYPSGYSSDFITAQENHSGFNAANLTAQQEANIKFVIAVGKGYGISAKGIQTAIATIIVESWCYNRYVVTDADSGGMFQQRPATGWGTAAQVRNKLLATRAFFGAASHTSNPGLIDYSSSLSIGDWAQKVQRSAYPDRYQAQAQTAINLYNSYAGSVAPYTG